jgi:hypothetical protein
MRVLIISFWFPPSNVVGAIRVGKLARYLVRHGHEPRVLTTDVVEDRSLPLEIPSEYVHSEYRRRRDWYDPLLRYVRRRSGPAVVAGGNVSRIEGTGVGKPA